MLTALLVTLGIVGYLKIGSAWARISWRTWGKKQRSVAGLLCFPASYQANCIGDYNSGDSDFNVFIASFHKEKDISNYTKTMAIAWPVKVVWIIWALTLITASKIFDRSLSIVGRIPTDSPQELLPAPPTEPIREQSDSYSESSRDEYQRLLAQSDKMDIEKPKIDARMKELEAEFKEENKIVRLPRRP